LASTWDGFISTCRLSGTITARKRLSIISAQHRRKQAHGWSYFGLSELYKARGNAEAARKSDEKLANTWIGDRAQLQLTRL
jgi:hypothetical protein